MSYKPVKSVGFYGGTESGKSTIIRSVLRYLGYPISAALSEGKENSSTLPICRISASISTGIGKDLGHGCHNINLIEIPTGCNLHELTEYLRFIDSCVVTINISSNPSGIDKQLLEMLSLLNLINSTCSLAIVCTHSDTSDQKEMSKALKKVKKTMKKRIEEELPNSSQIKLFFPKFSNLIKSKLYDRNTCNVLGRFILNSTCTLSKSAIEKTTSVLALNNMNNTLLETTSTWRLNRAFLLPFSVTLNKLVVRVRRDFANYIFNGSIKYLYNGGHCFQIVKMTQLDLMTDYTNEFISDGNSQMRSLSGNKRKQKGSRNLVVNDVTNQDLVNLLSSTNGGDSLPKRASSLTSEMPFNLISNYSQIKSNISNLSDVFHAVPADTDNIEEQEDSKEEGHKEEKEEIVDETPKKDESLPFLDLELEVISSFSDNPSHSIMPFFYSLPTSDYNSAVKTSENTFIKFQVKLKMHRFYKGHVKSILPQDKFANSLNLSVSVGPFTVPVEGIIFSTLPEDFNASQRCRYLKYPPAHSVCLATIYIKNNGFNIHHSWPVCIFKNYNNVVISEESSAAEKAMALVFRICATGSVLSKDIPVYKRLKLVGYPKKIYRNTAIITGMFTSDLEAQKYLKCKVSTTSKIRGIIKKSAVGKATSSKQSASNIDGSGDVRTTFEDKILMKDLVVLKSWVNTDTLIQHLS